jgi:CubicO group peptidase (beta-lactamase class C family)
MRIVKLTFVLVITTVFCLSLSANDVENQVDEKTNTAFSEDKLNALTQYLEKHGSSSMMIYYKGELVFSWGDVTKKHVIHSIRKTMLNALYGIYVGKGIIDLNLTLEQLKIDDIHGLTKQEKSATISDLLKSRSGIYHSATAESEDMLAAKPKRGTHKPNEFYYYNNWDFNTAGYIFEKITGKNIFEAFNDEIAKPLGMTEYQGKYTRLVNPKGNIELPQTDGFYQTETQLSNFPAYVFRMSTRDMARFAQLYLNKGKWQGQQIIPESWIELSTQAYSITNKKHNLGYGMLWGVVYNQDPNIPNSFYHTGNGVHMLAVYPQHEMLFVHRVDTEKQYSFRNQHLYPIISMVFDSLK